MKRFCLFIVGICISTMSFGQLVANGGFETITNPGCFFSGLGLIQWAAPWTYVDATEPADLFNTCYSFDANLQPPVTYRGNQSPRTGSGYAGILTQNDPTSDPRAGYLQIPLSAALIAGAKYDLTYYVSLADNYGTSMGYLGAYFSVGAVAPGDYSPLIMHGIAPQIQNDPFTHITDFTNWTQITGSYTASGGEDYLVIGNFNSTFAPPSIFTTYTCCGSILSYYFVDDVTLVFNPALPVELINFEAETQQKKVLLTWETASEKDNDYFTLERSKDGYNWNEITVIEGAGNSSVVLKYESLDAEPHNGINYYRLKQTDFNGEYEYSNTIYTNIKDENGVEISELYPNPSRNLISFRYTGKEVRSPIQVSIVNAFGEVMKTQTFNELTSQSINDVALDAIPSGVYQVLFTQDHKQTTKKLVIAR